MHPDQPEPTDTRERFSRVAYGVISSHIDATGTARHAAAGELAELVAVAVDAAYQRGLAAGQAERDQLRRLHEATEAALEQAEQYARDLQDDGVLTEEAREQGIAEGRRQATEGQERQWGARGPGGVEGFTSEQAARRIAGYGGGTVVSRLVSPWETAEQPEPGCPTCHTILNAKAAACSDPWHADNRPEPATGGVVDSAPVCTCPRVDVATSSSHGGAHHYVLGRAEPNCPFHSKPEEADRG